MLLVFMFDRIGRREYDLPFVVQFFAKEEIEVWSTQEGEQRFDNHVDKLMNYIRFWQASGESEKTSIRTKIRLGQIVQEGKFRGGVCPYGYELRKTGRKNSTTRTTPMSTLGQTLLSGNVFCGHCEGRLSPSTGGGTNRRVDGTLVSKKKLRYSCCNKTRKQKLCSGQTTYTAKVIDDLVEHAVRLILPKSKAFPRMS